MSERYFFENKNVYCVNMCVNLFERLTENVVLKIRSYEAVLTAFSAVSKL